VALHVAIMALHVVIMALHVAIKRNMPQLAVGLEEKNLVSKIVN
jgi:hypothetical protein